MGMIITHFPGGGGSMRLRLLDANEILLLATNVVLSPHHPNFEI